MGKKHKVAERYLQLHGYGKLGSCEDFLVFDDEGTVVFANIVVSDEEFIESSYKELRESFEHAMIAWFAEHREDHDFDIRCDELCIVKISPNRTLIRHYLNCINCMS